MQVPFVDLRLQHQSLAKPIETAMCDVARNADFILGRSVQAFEESFAAYCGSRFAVGVDSGISALELALRAHGIGEGDEVITVSHTFIATASSISFTGAKPVFVDVHPETFLIDPSRIESAVTERTKAIMVVHLYGQPADMDAVSKVAEKFGLAVFEDAAQAHGARYKNRRVGTFGLAGAFSCYPAKNLGAYGDAGILVTDSETIAERVKMLRNYGQRTKYDHVFLAFNRRLDTLQAAILNVKLPHLDGWNAARHEIAGLYRERLAKHKRLTLPMHLDDRDHVYHLFVIKHPYRDLLMQHLIERGVGCGLHYPIPVHKQECYKTLNDISTILPVTESLSSQILSLPMFPELTLNQVNYICGCIDEFESRQ